MKKLTALFLTACLGMTFISGCSGNKAADTSAKNQTSGSTSTASLQNDADLQKDTTLTYASWGDSDIENAMIKEFEKMYPKIKVNKIKALSSNNGHWNQSLAAYAAAGKLPDVFYIENTTDPLTNKWLCDLAPYLKQDADSKNILKNLMDMGTYNGKVMVLPRGLFIEGIFLDLDFLDKYNIDYPKYNWNTKDFEDILTKAKTNNTVGIVNVNALREILPGQFNKNLGWATFNGEKYGFNSGEWVEAVNYVKDIDQKQLTFESTPVLQRKSKFSTDDSFAAFTSGKIAMILDGSWTLSAIADAKVKFNWDFYPVPTKEGNDYSRPAMVCDYLGVSSNSENKRAAFEFAKWMSYSSTGYAKKIEIAQNGMSLFKKNKVITEMPVTNVEADRQKWMTSNHFDVKGIKEMFKHLDTGFIDLMKTVPGYQKSYFTTIASHYGDIEKGTFSASDKANEFNQKANQYYKEAVDAINQ